MARPAGHATFRWVSGLPSDRTFCPNDFDGPGGVKPPGLFFVRVWWLLEPEQLNPKALDMISRVSPYQSSHPMPGSGSTGSEYCGVRAARGQQPSRSVQQYNREELCPFQNPLPRRQTARTLLRIAPGRNLPDQIRLERNGAALIHSCMEMKGPGLASRFCISLLRCFNDLMNSGDWVQEDRLLRGFVRCLRRLALVAVLCLVWPGCLQAYIGPGAGFVFVSSFLALFFALFLAGVYLLFWPVRFLFQMVMGRRSRSSKKARIKRMVIIGLDGFDPKLAAQFMEAGKLPNLQRLKQARVRLPRWPPAILLSHPLRGPRLQQASMPPSTIFLIF